MAGQNNTTLRVVLPDSAPPATFRTVSVWGSVSRKGEVVRARASTGPALRQRFPRLLYPPPELDGQVVIGVIAPTN